MTARRGDIAGRLRAAWAGNPPTVHALVASSFVNRAGTLVVPFMAFYLSAERGISAGGVGAYMSIYGIGALLGGLFGGALTDRFSARDALGLAQVVSAVAAIGLAATRNDWLILVELAFFGAASQAGRPPFVTLIAAAVAGDRRLGAFQLLTWVGTVGILIASALGAVTVRFLGYSALFLFDGVTTLAAAVIVRRFVTGTGRRDARVPRVPAAAAQAAWLDPLLICTTVLAFIGSVLLTQAQVTLPVSMHADGLTGTSFGVVIVVNALVMIVLQAPLHSVVKKLPLSVAAGISTWLLGAGLGLTAFTHRQAAYLAATLVWSVGETPLPGLTTTIAANIAPPAMRGRYQGMATLAPNGAAAIGPLLGGLSLQVLGKGPFWGLCALLGLLAAGGYGAASRHVELRWRQPTVTAP